MNKVVIKNENGKTSIEINGMTIKGVIDFKFEQESYDYPPIFNIKFYATDTKVEN